MGKSRSASAVFGLLGRLLRRWRTSAIVGRFRSHLLWRNAANPEFLTRNCVACHNQRLKTAGLALDAADMTQVGADAEVGKGRAEAPHRFDAAGRAGRGPMPAAPLAFVTGLESALDRAAAANVEPGPSRRSPPEPR